MRLIGDMMDKVKVHEVIIVEGKYDLNAIKQIVDGIVITTDGFGVFHNQEKLQLIRRMAESRGVVILTDSDGAGFVIRNYLKGCLPKECVKHAYIPDVYGKERRKRTGSKEGKLGVEGMNAAVLRETLRKAGVLMAPPHDTTGTPITKADLFSMGLSGGNNSNAYRKKLMAALELPEKLSPNALLDVLNGLFTRDEFIRTWNEIKDK